MKTRLLLTFAFLVFAFILVSANHAYGIWLPQSSEELLEESQVIVIGTITSVSELELEQPTYNEDYPLTLDEYTVTIEEFVKNPQNAETITVRQPTVSTPGRLLPFEGFEVGDRVLFYIKSFDGINTYSKESFLIPKQCDSSSVIHKPRIIGIDYSVIQNGVEKKDNFTANQPMQFTSKRDMGTLSGTSLEYHVFISKQVEKTYRNIVLNQTITAYSQPCEWLSVAQWEFTPDAGNYLLNGRIYENTKNLPIGNKFFSVLAESPLKQIKNGVSLVDVKCNEGKTKVVKHDRMLAACVNSDSEAYSKLIDRGWATMRFHTEEETSAHALCNNYQGKWHPEHSGCRGDISDLQCSLIGGTFVDNLKICYNDICPEDKIYTLCVTSSDESDSNMSGTSIGLPSETSSLRPGDKLQIRHSAGYTAVHITLSSWDEYNEWESGRGPEHDAMPPMIIDDSNMNPIVFDLLNEMWKFENYDVSKYDDTLFIKTIQKDYSVPNHHGIKDWLKYEYAKQFGESDDGYSHHFEYQDNVYSVIMVAYD